MDTFVLIVQGLLVLGCIYMGVREGGLGLGIWGLLGVFVMVFVFHEAPGDPPIDAVFIVIAVITAASAMQAAGGTDWMVSVAARVIQSRPQSVVFLAPAMSFLFTVGAGTGNIYYPLLPVIYDVSYRQKIRPERPLAISAVASQVGILCSPVSAATAAMVTVLAKADSDFELSQLLLVMWPACIVGLAVAAFVQSKRGKELDDDPIYQERLAQGLVKPPETSDILTKDLPSSARTSALLFLAGVGLIVILGLWPGLRPDFDDGSGGTAPVSIAVTIQVIMGVIGGLILLLPGVKGGDVAKQSVFTSGMTGAIALFGLAWLAATFVAAHQTEITDGLSDVVQDHKLLFAAALFATAALTTSQSGATNAIVPIGVSLGLSVSSLVAMWPSVMGMYFFPANGSQVATVAFDETGTTRIGKAVVNHSFLLPTLIVVFVGMAVGFAVAPLVS